ncbi:hypothetical protein BD311DRAFT_748379 [Dichomitus squalens]|uniref:Secreted protein n=1 Tax=Dichomitus squalens TaxID=114155 RepID=A0A4Q9N0K8_9APHY|nr:hypothetical protein BD311DRAFT_748379 [Dichomitus squalens]
MRSSTLPLFIVALCFAFQCSLVVGHPLSNHPTFSRGSVEDVEYHGLTTYGVVSAKHHRQDGAHFIRPWAIYHGQPTQA